MEAIKKKMQAMKVEKDNAMDRCDACEEGSKAAKLRAEKAEEEVAELMNKVWKDYYRYCMIRIILLSRLDNWKLNWMLHPKGSQLLPCSLMKRKSPCLQLKPR